MTTLPHVRHVRHVDASSEDTALLTAHLQRLVHCSAEDAQGMLMKARRDGKPLPPDASREYRMRCNYEMRRAVLEYRSRAQSPPPHPPLCAENGEDNVEDNAEDDTNLPACPACGSVKLEHEAIQIRRGDEGPTNFFKCKNQSCKCFNTMVRPVYKN